MALIAIASDYMLDNPEEVYRHYYNYYRRRVAPKVDVRVVILVTITVISAVQYYSGWQRYHEAIGYLATVPKYRLQAGEIGRQEGLFSVDKRARRRDREAARRDDEQTIRRIIAERMDVSGAHAKPTWRDLLWVQIVLFPYSAAVYLAWYARWTLLFTLGGRPFGDEELFYLIRKNLGSSAGQYAALSDDERAEHVRLRLYDRAAFSEWKARQDERARAKLAESGKYKSYRRYMKKGGAGQISFLDDE